MVSQQRANIPDKGIQQIQLEFPDANALAFEAREHADLNAPPGTPKHAAVVVNTIARDSLSPQEAAASIERAHEQGELGIDVDLLKRHMVKRERHADVLMLRRLARNSIIHQDDMNLFDKGFTPSAQMASALRRAKIIKTKKQR